MDRHIGLQPGKVVPNAEQCRQINIEIVKGWEQREVSKSDCMTNGAMRWSLSLALPRREAEDPGRDRHNHLPERNATLSWSGPPDVH